MVKVEPITVEISKSIIEDSQSPESLTISILKEAGIPITGMLLFRGLESGTLIWNESFETGCMEYTWTP